jgi:hypothetical protein
VKLEADRGDKMGVRAEKHGSPVKNRRPRITILPATHLGWWAVGLTAAFFLLVFAATVVPRGAAFGFVSGLAGGIVALMAIVRERERAVAVFAALVPLAIAVGFVLSQLISGNP